jgi:hypothetical protein
MGSLFDDEPVTTHVVAELPLETSMLILDIPPAPAGRPLSAGELRLIETVRLAAAPRWRPPPDTSGPSPP